MFMPRFATLGSDVFSQPRSETITYSMNDIVFTAETFNAVFARTLEDSNPKIRFNKETTQNSIFNSNSSNVSMSIEKPVLSLLLKGNKDENIDQFRTYLLEFLNNLSLNFNIFIQRAETIKETLDKLYKTMLIHRNCIEIDIEHASDFHARYVSLLMLQLYACLSSWMSQDEFNIRKFAKSFQFIMNFNKGLTLDTASDTSSEVFSRTKLENAVYGILRNAPKIRKDIDSFSFFKQNPGLKALNSRILEYYIALANEYVTKLNINLEQVAERHPTSTMQQLRERCSIM